MTTLPQATAPRSDQPTMLDKWTARDEAKLQQAVETVRVAQARRQVAEKAVADAFGDAIGAREDWHMTPATMTLIIEHAKEIRDVLAPFDNGERPAEVAR